MMAMRPRIHEVLTSGREDQLYSRVAMPSNIANWNEWKPLTTAEFIAAAAHRGKRLLETDNGN